MKPENIFMGEDGYVAVADYGLAKMLDGHMKTSTYAGTPDYMAPEML
jgi:serine/threonine protein kinase